MILKLVTSMALALVLATILFCGSGCEEIKGTVSYRPLCLPVKLVIDSLGKCTVVGDQSIVTPIGTFSIGAKCTIPKDPEGITVILRNTQTRLDEVYRIRHSDSLVAVLNGKTVVEVTNEQVLIDVTEGNISSISFREGQAPLKMSTKGFWDDALFSYRPFVLAKWAYSDSMIEKWNGLGFVVYLVRLLGVVILGIIDIFFIIVLGIGQCACFFFGTTGRNLAVGFEGLLIVLWLGKALFGD